MLSYIWQQHCRMIAFSRCLIVKCGVTPLKVVGVNILSNGSSGFFDVIILCQIGFFILEATKPALNHDIVRPAAFSIHALVDAVFFYEINVLLTCELTSLVRIAPTEMGNSLVVKRFWTKFTFVVRSTNFFRFF